MFADDYQQASIIQLNLSVAAFLQPEASMGVDVVGPRFGGKGLESSQMLLVFELEVHEPADCFPIVDLDGDLLAGHDGQLGEFPHLGAIEVVLARGQDDIALAGIDLTEAEDDDGSDGDDGDDDDGGEDEQAHGGHGQATE